MLSIEEVKTLHAQWDRLYKVHREATQHRNQYFRIESYKDILLEDKSHPGAFIGLATSTDNPADAAAYAGVLLDMGMRQDFVLRIVGSILKSNPALGTAFSRWREEPTPTISAAMIVRDESDCIARCLDNILPFVDQCVVVDTGSMDNTAEICEDMGAEVHHHPWEEDYGKARNQALDYVTSDWVLWIDADEYVGGDGGRQIREAMKNPEAQAMMVRIHNDYGDDEPPSVIEFPRVWRHDERCPVRWSFYEDISWAIYPLCQRYYRKVLDMPDLRILHDGYRPEKMASRGKKQRNLRMMYARLYQDPDDQYARLHLAQMLRHRGMFDHAEGHFTEWQRQLDKGAVAKGDAMLITGFAEFGDCLAALGRYDQAVSTVKLGVDLLGESDLLSAALSRTQRLADRAGLATA